jgi:hypothetical protein
MESREEIKKKLLLSMDNEQTRNEIFKRTYTPIYYHTHKRTLNEEWVKATKLDKSTWFDEYLGEEFFKWVESDKQSEFVKDMTAIMSAIQLNKGNLKKAYKDVKKYGINKKNGH